MTKRRFWILAIVIAWFGRDGVRGQTQPTPVAIHMTAGATGFADASGVAWTPNTCTGWVAFNNPGTFPNPIYNTPAYTQTAGVPIVCPFTGVVGVYEVLIHLIEAVKSFNTPQKRIFNVLVNGQPALTNIDVYQRAGGVEIPYDVVTYTTATPTGGIQVSFTQVKSSAMFAGIELLPVAQPGLTVLDANSQPIGVASSYGVAAGVGIICTQTVSDSGTLFVQCGIDDNVVPSTYTLQGATNPLICVSSSNNGGAYTASCTPKLTTLGKNQFLLWFPDVTNTGSETLTIDSTSLDSLGNPTMKVLTRSGAALPAGWIAAGTPYWIWNDGANWRLFDEPTATVARWQCNSSGPGWDCTGLQMVKLTMPDGSTRGPYAGVLAGPELAGNGNWVPVPANAPDK